MSSIVVNHRPINHPPGTSGHWFFGTAREFGRDPLGMLIEYHRQFGDALRFRFFLHFYGYSFTHPDYYKHILQDNNKNYTKQPHPANQLLRLLGGDGLLTADGDYWLWQRRLAQPAFHRRRIATFGDIMTDATLAMLDRWNYFDLEKPFDFAEEMSHLTLGIAGKTMFGTDLTGEASTVGESFNMVNEEFAVLNVMPFGTLIARLPIFPRSRRMQAGIRLLNKVVEKTIAERRQSGRVHDDLLGMLMEARDEETGEGMDDKLLRDEVMTLMLAGHETTAVALSWTFYLLATHPQVLSRLEAELDEVLAGRTPGIEDLRDLHYARMVLDETLRLYPPAYVIARWGQEPDVVGGYDLTGNASITLVTYLLHRHPDFWPRPEQFDPERFTPEKVAERPRFAYAPFGGGPRQCIGNTFALSEATLLLATILQRYRPEPVPGHKAELEPLITLRPKGGMPLYMRPR